MDTIARRSECRGFIYHRLRRDMRDRMTPGREAEHPHENVIAGIAKQLRTVLEGSKQGVYVYLDDTHKICNQRMADLLGYGSVEEWSGVDARFTEAFVDDESRNALVSAYQRAMADKVGSCVDVTWRKRAGGSVKTKVILVPISYEGSMLALHFITMAR